MKNERIYIMKKILALLLILSICSLCFLVSCRDNNDPSNNPDGPGTGEVDDGDGDDSIIDIGDGEGILNEDNIDPNGWTKID